MTCFVSLTAIFGILCGDSWIKINLKIGRLMAAEPLGISRTMAGNVIKELKAGNWSSRSTDTIASERADIYNNAGEKFS